MANPTTQHKQPSARTPGDILAMASFVVSLVFPVALLIHAVGVVISRFTTEHSQPFPFLALIYAALDYYAIPVIVLALLLGHVAVARADAWRLFAKRGLIIAYASFAGLVLLFATLHGAAFG
jgi:hypothetical protein